MMPEGIPLQRELSTHFTAFQASFGPKQIIARRYEAARQRPLWLWKFHAVYNIHQILHVGGLILLRRGPSGPILTLDP